MRVVHEVAEEWAQHAVGARVTCSCGAEFYEPVDEGGEACCTIDAAAHAMRAWIVHVQEWDAT